MHLYGRLLVINREGGALNVRVNLDSFKIRLVGLGVGVPSM